MEMRDKVNGAVRKRPRPIMAETECYIVHQWRTNTGCSIHGWQTKLSNSYIFPFGDSRDSILTNIDCMCWAGKNAF